MDYAKVKCKRFRLVPSPLLQTVATLSSVMSSWGTSSCFVAMLLRLFLSRDHQWRCTDQRGQRIISFPGALLLGVNQLDDGKYRIRCVFKRLSLTRPRGWCSILAIYLIKRTLRNRQRHGLEEHEVVRTSLLRLSLMSILSVLRMPWKIWERNCCINGISSQCKLKLSFGRRTEQLMRVGHWTVALPL